ncbi:MAG: DNA-binding protein [Microbacterium sp.]|nr:MAG: DNA-binding protein [Microbacterium sp.]
MASKTTLVDANVLLDVLTEDAQWATWSAEALADAARDGELLINPIIYAEVSVRFDSLDNLDAAIPATILRRESLPYDAAFLAGKAFVAYRRSGGSRTSPLPDFYIGAHALVAGHALLTRDAARYRTYFPELTVISPA